MNFGRVGVRLFRREPIWRVGDEPIQGASGMAAGELTANAALPLSVPARLILFPLLVGQISHRLLLYSV